jgi:hypothetical protein
MANILAPFGFRHLGYMEGAPPTMGMRYRKIALGNTNPIFRGDPVVSLNTGYIAQATSNAVQIAGIFHGCEYYSISQQRKVRSRYWPGSDAQYDVDAFIIDTSSSQWLVQTNGGGTGTGGSLPFSAIDFNAGFFVTPGGSASPAPTSGLGNTVSGYSGAMLDTAGSQPTTPGTPATTPGLPFRILALYSDYAVPGAPLVGGTQGNGADNTTAYNWAVIGFNNADTKSLTGI